MKVVCAYCGKDMGEKNGSGVEGVSHGVCEACSEDLCRQAEPDSPGDGSGSSSRHNKVGNTLPKLRDSPDGGED